MLPMRQNRLPSKPGEPSKTQTLKAKSLINRIKLPHRRRASSLASPKPKGEKQRKDLNGTNRRPQRRRSLLLRIAWPPKLLQKCCEIMQTSAVSTLRTLSRCYSKKKPKDTWQRQPTVASTLALSLQLQTNEAEEISLIQATCHICTRTLLFEID